MSEPPTSILVGSWSLPPQAVDLRLFTVADVGLTPAPTWNDSSNGASAVETVQSIWTYLVANFDSVTERFEADLEVNANDDDFIGLAFGYQDPRHNYLLQWKAGSQAWGSSTTLRGISVRAIDNANNDARHYAESGGYLNTSELYFHDVGAWARTPTRNHLAIDFDPGLFTVSVSRGATALDSVTIEDATYLTGRFALFAYEQHNVSFTNVRRTVRAHSDYVYEVEVAGLDEGEHATFSLVSGPSGMTIDAETGRVFWQMSARSVGLHAVTVRVSDGAGGSVDQSFTLEVVDGGPCYEAPATLPCGP